MINDDKVCRICNENKKFLGLVNTGKKYYCNSCIAKINKSGMDYWKPCSMEEGFENYLSTRKKLHGGSSNMFSSMREEL